MQRLFVFLAGVLWASVAVGQILSPPFPLGLFGNQNARDPPATIPYAGPGDVVSGATAWYGLRAYNASNLNGTTKAVNLVRASDSTACDFDIAVTGGLGTSDSGCSLGGGLTLSTFATVDATATCTMLQSSSSASCTGASSTPHVKSQVLAAGLSQPCYVSAVGTFTGGSGTVTVNDTETSCAPLANVTNVTFTFNYNLGIAKAYDLTGNGNTLLQATGASQWRLYQNCVGTKPCMFASVFDPDFMKVTITAVSDPKTVSSVIMRPANTGGAQGLFAFQGGTGLAFGGFGNGENEITLIEGSVLTVLSVADGVFHSVQYLADGASSSINVDGTITTGSTTTGQTGATTLTAGAESNGSSFPLYGAAGEMGFYSSALSTTNQGLLCHNQYTYWGTAVSC